MEFVWEPDYSLKVTVLDGEVLISANREGLVSLSNHLLELSRQKEPSHFHLDEFNVLEEGSSELIVELIE